MLYQQQSQNGKTKEENIIKQAQKQNHELNQSKMQSQI